MMGKRTVLQELLFYSFYLDRHAPMNHMLRSVDRFVDVSGIREHLKPYYSDIGRPSIDPELMTRMLIVGYCFGVHSEPRPCDEARLNLGYRWFCRLSLDIAVPDHSTFSKVRHGRFRDADLLRHVFKTVAPLHGRRVGRRRGLRRRWQSHRRRCVSLKRGGRSLRAETRDEPLTFMTISLMSMRKVLALRQVPRCA